MGSGVQQWENRYSRKNKYAARVGRHGAMEDALEAASIAIAGYG
jgi:hypothetical protein